MHNRAVRSLRRNRIGQRVAGIHIRTRRRDRDGRIFRAGGNDSLRYRRIIHSSNIHRNRLGDRPAVSIRHRVVKAASAIEIRRRRKGVLAVAGVHRNRAAASARRRIGQRVAISISRQDLASNSHILRTAHRHIIRSRHIINSRYGNARSRSRGLTEAIGNTVGEAIRAIEVGIRRVGKCRAARIQHNRAIRSLRRNRIGQCIAGIHIRTRRRDRDGRIFRAGGNDSLRYRRIIHSSNIHRNRLGDRPAVSIRHRVVKAASAIEIRRRRKGVLAVAGVHRNRAAASARRRIGQRVAISISRQDLASNSHILRTAHRHIIRSRHIINSRYGNARSRSRGLTEAIGNTVGEAIRAIEVGIRRVGKCRAARIQHNRAVRSLRRNRIGQRIAGIHIRTRRRHRDKRIFSTGRRHRIRFWGMVLIRKDQIINDQLSGINGRRVAGYSRQEVL